MCENVFIDAHNCDVKLGDFGPRLLYFQSEDENDVNSLPNNVPLPVFYSGKKIWDPERWH